MRLIEGASRVFARRGYHEARVEEIARDAGYSTGAVYSNFSGKEELFLALVDQQVQARIAEVQAVAKAAAEPDEAGAQVAEHFRAFFARDPDWPLLFYEFWSYARRKPARRREFDQRRGAVRGAIAEALEDVARRQGVGLCFPAEQLAAVISATLNGLAFDRAVHPEALPQELVAFTISALLDAARVPPNAEKPEQTGSDPPE